MQALLGAAWLLAGNGAATPSTAEGMCAEEGEASALLQLDRHGRAAHGLTLAALAELERVSIMRIQNWEQLSVTCEVGERVYCPAYENSTVMCAGDECCPSLVPGDDRWNFICPSASPEFKGCGIMSKLRNDCTSTLTNETDIVPFPTGPAEAETEMPDGWEMDIDNASGTPYFFNRETNETLWEHPR